MTREKVKDTLASAGIQAVVGLLAFVSLWFLTVRDDITEIKGRLDDVEQHEIDNKAYRATAVSDAKEATKEMAQIKEQLVEVKTKLDFIGRGLRIKGYE